MTPAELRDFFAGLAMQAIITGEATGEQMGVGMERSSNHCIAERAYKHAVAMIREREKPWA